MSTFSSAPSLSVDRLGPEYSNKRPNTPGKLGISAVSLELLVRFKSSYAARKGLIPKEFHDLNSTCLRHVYSFLDMNSIFSFGQVNKQTQDCFELSIPDLCIHIRSSAVYFINISGFCDFSSHPSLHEQLLSAEEGVLFSNMYLKGSISDIPRFVDRCSKKLQTVYLWFDVVPNTSILSDNLEQMSRIIATRQSQVSTFILRFADCFATVDLSFIFESLAGKEPEIKQPKFGQRRYKQRTSLPVIAMTQNERARARTKSKAVMSQMQENELPPCRQAGSPKRTRSAKSSEDSLSVASDEIVRSQSARGRSGGLLRNMTYEDDVMERRSGTRMTRSRSGIDPAELEELRLNTPIPRRHWHSVRNVIVDCTDLENVKYDGHQLARFVSMFENLEDICLFLPMEQRLFAILQREFYNKQMLLTTKFMKSREQCPYSQSIPVEWIDHEHCLTGLKRASLSNLITWACDQLHGADAVMKLLLFTFPSFTSPLNFIRLLCNELQSAKTEERRIRVGYVFKMLFEEFWLDYFVDAELRLDTKDMLNLLKSHRIHTVGRICRTLLRTMRRERGDESWMFMSMQKKVAIQAPRRLYTNMIAIAPEKIADYMTQSNKKYFERMRHHEFLKQDYEVVQLVTDRYNSLQVMITHAILVEETSSKRAQLIQHFIRVAQVLDENNDLFSCSIVVNALELTPVHRLRKTWDRINYKKQSQLQKLRKLFSPTKSYALLRHRHGDSNMVLLPHLGIYMQDFVFIGENRTFIEEEVNVAKFYLFCMHFTQFKIWQMASKATKFSVEDDVANFLETTRIRNGHWSEDHLWELSNACEPSNRNAHK